VTLNRGSRSGNTMVDGFGQADSLLCHVGGVGRRREAGELLDGAIGQAGQHVGQVLANGYAQLAAALDEAEDRGDLRHRFFTSQVQTIPTADGNGTHRVFGPICR